MSEFELIVIPLSVVLGVGVTWILGGLIHAIRHREHSEPHWLPIVWASLIFMYNVGYFNVLWEINEGGLAWTWPLFGMQLTSAVLLFMGAGLILASDDQAVELGMLGYFEEHGRLALIPLGVFFALSIPFNKWSGGPDWVSAPNLLNLLLLASLVAVFRAEQVRLRALGTFVFAVVSAYGWFVVFARPGVD